LSTSNDPTGADLTVGLDATSLLDRPTGVGVFTREVLTGLADRPDVDVRALAVSWRGRDRLADVVPDGVAVVGRRIPARLARQCWLRSDHPTVARLAGPVDVVHGPNFVVPPGGAAAEVVTVHDLTALRYPELCTADVLQWPPLLARALDRGAWVHTVSGFVADELRDRHPEAADRIVAIPNGVAPPAPATPRSDEAAVHVAREPESAGRLGEVESPNTSAVSMSEGTTRSTRTSQLRRTKPPRAKSVARTSVDDSRCGEHRRFAGYDTWRALSREQAARGRRGPRHHEDLPRRPRPQHPGRGRELRLLQLWVRPRTT